VEGLKRSDDKDFRRAQFYFAEHSKTKTASYGTALSLHVRYLKDDDADLTVVVGNNYKRSVPYWEYGGEWATQFEDLEHYLLDNGIQHGDTAELLYQGLVYNENKIRK